MEEAGSSNDDVTLEGSCPDDEALLEGYVTVLQWSRVIPASRGAWWQRIGRIRASYLGVR